MNDQIAQSDSNGASHITIDEFKKIEARVGTVRVAEIVPDSDKLLRCEIDFGDETRQILSAIREWYPDPSVLIGKQLLYCTNLAPRTIRGLRSNGMLMAVDGPDGAPVFLVPEKNVLNGTKLH